MSVCRRDIQYYEQAINLLMRVAPESRPLALALSNLGGLLQEGW